MTSRALLAAAAVCGFFPAAASADTAPRLMVGCATPKALSAVVVGFAGPSGPDVLNAKVRAKECRWIKGGEEFRRVDALATGEAVKITTGIDAAAWWVPAEYFEKSQ